MSDTEKIILARLQRIYSRSVRRSNDVLDTSSYTSFDLGENMYKRLFQIEMELKSIQSILCNYSDDSEFNHNWGKQSYEPLRGIPDSYRPEIPRPSLNYAPELLVHLEKIENLHTKINIITNLLSASISCAKDVYWGKQKAYMVNIVVNNNYLVEVINSIRELRSLKEA